MERFANTRVERWGIVYDGLLQDRAAEVLLARRSQRAGVGVYLITQRRGSMLKGTDGVKFFIQISGNADSCL